MTQLELHGDQHLSNTQIGVGSTKIKGIYLIGEQQDLPPPSFWADILGWINEECPHCVNMTFSDSFIVFGVKQNIRTDKVFDLILLLAKFHVYKCKLQNIIPNKPAFKQSLKNRYNIEMYNHAISFTMDKFRTNWLPYANLVM